jgi:hypothetical protein
MRLLAQHHTISLPSLSDYSYVVLLCSICMIHIILLLFIERLFYFLTLYSYNNCSIYYLHKAIDCASVACATPCYRYVHAIRTGLLLYCLL